MSNLNHQQPAKKKIDTKVEENAVKTNSVGLSFWDFLRMIFAMIFVVALLYFVLRFIGKKTKSYQKANFIENLGGTGLGGNRSVQLVKVGRSDPHCRSRRRYSIINRN